MTTHLRFHELTMHTRAGNQFSYRFRPGINVISGEVGSGKSSLLELLKYALGADAVLTPAVLRGLKFLTLEASVGATRISFARGLRGDLVEARELDGTLMERLATSDGHGMRTASAFLLDLLDLPTLRITNSRPTGRNVPLTFFDLYNYAYLAQAEIDRSVVHHLDPSRRSKRVAGFELLMGLTDTPIAELRVRLGLLREELPHARARLEVAGRLLGGMTPLDETQLAERRAAALNQREEGAALLASLRSELHVATAGMSEQESQLAAVRARAFEKARQVAELEVEVERRMQQRAEALSQLERLGRVSSAAEVLGSIRFMQCPRCLQELAADRVPADRCVVCTQPEPRAEPTGRDPGDVEAEYQRLRALVEELEELTAESRAQLERALAERRVLDAALHEQSIEVDRHTTQFISPRFDQIARASAIQSRAESELRSLELSASLWRERTALADELQRVESEIRGTMEELKQSEQEIAALRRQRVNELSEVFDEIIQALDMPWYQQGARVDQKTYLPVVNGVGIENLGSGGMKMMTNVAYHLALLTYGLAEASLPIPDLLVIDSPRKNLGVTDEDQAHATRFYEWVAALVGVHVDRFQLIVADNDPPTGDIPVANRIDLSHEQPLVRDLPHPGEGVATIGT